MQRVSNGCRDNVIPELNQTVAHLHPPYILPDRDDLSITVNV